MMGIQLIKPEVNFDKDCEYQTYKLKDVLDRVVNPVSLEKDKKYYEIGIRSHGKGIFYKPSTTINEIGNKRVFWIEKDLLILNVVFAWEQAVARTTDNEVGKIASHRFPMYKTQSGKLDLDYLMYFFLTEQGKKLLGLASPGGAGRNKTLGQKAFENLNINLPPIEEQKKIAKFIKSVDSKIQLLDSELASLLGFKKGVLQRILVQIGNNKKWPLVPLKSVLKEKKTKNRERMFSKENVLSVSGKYGIVNQIEHLGRSYAGKSVLEYSEVKVGDIVYTKSPLKNNPFGVIKSNKGQAGIVSTLYAVFECQNINTSVYIENYFELDDNTNRYLRPLIHKGAKNDMKISNQRFLAGDIELPPINKQIKINSFKAELDNKIINMEGQIELFKKFRLGLLQRLYIKRN